METPYLFERGTIVDQNLHDISKLQVLLAGPRACSKLRVWGSKISSPLATPQQQNDILTHEEDHDSAEDDIFNVGDSIQKLNLNGYATDIPEWLQDVESPFNWLQVRFPDVPSKEIITKATERTEIDEGLDDSFPYEKFVRTLILVFELGCQGEYAAAWTNFKSCEELLKNEKIKDENTYSELSEALNHALQATKAHLLLRTGQEAEAKQVVASLQPVRDMSVHGLAAVQGLRAWFFRHYRWDGASLALQYARQALALVPDSPLWLLLTSQSIRRQRKLKPTLEEVSTEEVELLEQAVNIERSARHLLLLAQAYREASDCRFKKLRSEPDFFHSQTFLEISSMQAKAFELYKEALSLRPDSEVVNRLCGYGLLRLPAFKSNYRLAERSLQRALELDPTNATTIHALGLYYYKGLMDYEKAALFCEKAGKLGNFPASVDMLRMKRLVYGSNYDPVFDFQKLLHQYGDDQTMKHEILCQMGSYYLFFERNLSKALKYFKTLVEEKAELSIITSHKCTFLNMACKINLFQCIVNEGLQLLQKYKERNLKMEENSLSSIKIFLDDLKVTNPELFNMSVDVNLIDDLHKVSDDIKQTYIRKKERRDSMKDRRRSSLTNRRSSLDNNISISNLRRQSESSINFRRRSSGNIESFQNRLCKTLNSPESKQQSLETSNVEKECKESHKSNGYFLDSGSNNFRRRSSGAISDAGQNRPITSPYNLKQKSLFGGSQVSETIKETSHETGQSLLKSGGFGKSNDSKNMTAKQGNARPLYKRYVSWSGNAAQENQTNWRVKDDKQ